MILVIYILSLNNSKAILDFTLLLSKIVLLTLHLLLIALLNFLYPFCTLIYKLLKAKAKSKAKRIDSKSEKEQQLSQYLVEQIKINYKKKQRTYTKNEANEIQSDNFTSSTREKFNIKKNFYINTL